MDRSPLKLLGRTIGTFDGWDGDMDWTIFYQFEPIGALQEFLPPGDLQFKVEAGTLSYSDDAGNDTKVVDVIEIMTKISKDSD